MVDPGQEWFDMISLTHFFQPRVIFKPSINKQESLLASISPPRMINNRWYLSCLICSLETVYIKYAYVSCRNSYITLSDIMTWPISFISVPPIFHVEKDCTDLTGGFLFQTLCGHFLLPTELRRLRLDLISEKSIDPISIFREIYISILKKNDC